MSPHDEIARFYMEQKQQGNDGYVVKGIETNGPNLLAWFNFNHTMYK